MRDYDYREAMKEDIYNYLEDNYYMLDLPEDTEKIDFDELLQQFI